MRSCQILNHPNSPINFVLPSAGAATRAATSAHRTSLRPVVRSLRPFSPTAPPPRNGPTLPVGLVTLRKTPASNYFQRFSFTKIGVVRSATPSLLYIRRSLFTKIGVVQSATPFTLYFQRSSFTKIGVTSSTTPPALDQRGFVSSSGGFQSSTTPPLLCF